MKTIEEKAKAYDRVSKEVKDFFEGRQKMYSDVNQTLEYLFPELKESEGEKVRKELLVFCRTLATGRTSVLANNIDFNKWISWLERQGEHANFRYKIQVGDKVTRNEAGVLVNLSQLNRVAKKNEKQGEQKFEMKSAAESLGVDSETYNKIVDECIFGEQKPADSYCQENCKGFQETGKCFADGDCKAKREGEQKPEENKGNIGGISPNWSEEDEELVKWSIHNLTELKDRYGEEYGKVGKCIDWLKSLKGRVNPHPKQEWSEEDEKNLRRAIRATKVVYPVAADWLKSLQDRVQPKPMCKFGDTELTQEELCEGLIRGMVNEHNRVTKEVLRTEYEKGRADVLAKIDAIDVDEMVCESGATSRVTQYWYAHGVNDVIKKLKEEEI